MWAFMAGGAIADNFVFAVPGEPGVTLRFNGYDTEGKQIFAGLSSAPEQFSGELHYVVRVDGKVLANGALAKWCVTDAFLKWEPTKALNTKVLCDESPVEVGGAYTFDAAELMPTSATESNDTPQTASEGFSAKGVDRWWGGTDPVTEWTRICRDEDNSTCLVRRDAINGDGSIAASLILRSRPDAGDYAVQIRLPAGGLVNAPATWQVDAKDVQKVPIKYCYGEWCVSEALADEDGIASFKAGNALKVGSMDMSNTPNSVTFGLDGFTRTFDGPATIQPVQDSPELASALESYDLRKACQGDTCIFTTAVAAESADEISGRFLLRLSEGKAPLIMISLPHGVDLQRGIIFEYAGNSATQQGYLTCDPQYCTSLLAPSDQFLARILLTDNFIVRAMDLEGNEYSATFDLRGLKEMTEADE